MKRGKGDAVVHRPTPGRCPLWGRHTPGAPGSTPGRLSCRHKRASVTLRRLSTAWGSAEGGTAPKASIHSVVLILRMDPEKKAELGSTPSVGFVLSEFLNGLQVY